MLVILSAAVCAVAPLATPLASDPLFVATDAFATGTYTFLIDEGDADGDGSTEYAVASVDGVTVIRRDGQSLLIQGTGHAPAPLGSSALIPQAGPVTGILSFNEANQSELKFSQSNSTGWTTQSLQQLDSPRGGVWADFNNDQVDDFAVCSVTAGTVSTFLTSGAPGGTALTTGGFSRPLHLTSGDFNGDGNEDLVVASQNDSEFVLLLGDGTGAFVNSGPLNPPTIHQPIWSHSTDLDGDGDIDLVLAYRTGSLLEVWWNDGTGATASVTPIQAPFGELQCVTTLDYDLDGDMDLAATAMFAGKVIIFEAVQSGTWIPHEFDTPNARIMVASDWDLDGDDDLLVGSWNSAGGLSILTNFTNEDCDGNGQVDSAEINANPSLDWNGDGLLDACAGGGYVYCNANLNASGAFGLTEPLGSPLIGDDSFSLRAFGLPTGNPGVPGMFIMSRSTGYLNPFGGGAGVLCLGAPIRRFNLAAGFPLQFSGAAGEITLNPSIASFPGPNPVQPGEVIHFQLWFREVDLTTGLPTSNTTDGISVMFR